MISVSPATIAGIAALLILCPFFIPADDDLGDSPNEDKPSNEYFSKKDFKVISVAVVVIIIVAIPMYIVMKGQLNAYLCRLNLQAISVSMSNYTLDNDDRLPPLYVSNPNNGLPALDSLGLPSVWASTLVNLSGFDPKRSFLCPSASENDALKVEGAEGKSMSLSYGLFAGVAARSKSDFANASNVVMVTDTDNGGAEGSFDPHPIRPSGPNGKIMDGFVIGFSTGDLIPSDGKLPLIGGNLFPRAGITRLAFTDTQNGITNDSTSSRHEGRVLALFLDGHYGFLNARQVQDQIHWQLPVNNQ